MKVYVTLRGVALTEVRERVAELDAMGVAGVLVGDHLFIAGAGPRAQARRPPEPLTTLATVATLSDRLEVGTIVSNIGFLHPALALRQFANLASLFGGERVLAGIGAGWNREEFEAIGQTMPGFRARMERLEEAARLARQLFDRGLASIEGSHVVARELPLAPQPSVPPRLLLGGGSDRLLDIAGRYADALDLNGSSRRGGVVGPDLPGADTRRRLSTTVADLEASVERVRSTSQASGRPRGAVSLSVLVGDLEFCSNADVPSVTERITAAAGLAAQSLDECPYVLLGEPERVADMLAERRERLGLEAVILAGTADWRRFCERVLPRLATTRPNG
jgi:alkanesulfonate monooxygenase SsuD/methylene tetrahydromethanopterin reductase-like flavin-dependent oxidoreductase (luciferase family)